MDYYTADEQLFINALIEKKDIKDCYTKAYTIQNQGCDMFALFWKIYIDYYAHINPKLEVFIMKKQNAWNNKKDNIITEISFDYEGLTCFLKTKCHEKEEVKQLFIYKSLTIVFQKVFQNKYLNMLIQSYLL